jgi:hypothetical protein
MEDAEEGGYLRVRVDIAAREQIEKSLAGVIFNDVTFNRHAPVDGMIRTQLDLRGFERIPEPEKLPSVVHGPRAGYKRVDLTYFAEAGKRYTEGVFWTPEDRFDFNVYATVETLRANGELPGIMGGSNWPYGSILVRPEDGGEALLPALENDDEDEG